MSPSPFKSSIAAALAGLGLAALLGLLGLLGAAILIGDENPESVALSEDASAVILGRLAQARNLPFALETTTSGKALVLQDADFPARAMPIVSYSLSYPGTLETLFVWERRDSEGTVHHRELPSGAGVISLSEETEWNGQIRRFGLLVRPADQPPSGAPDGQHVIEGTLRVEPSGITQSLRVLASGWLADRPWTGASINHLGRSVLPVMLTLWAVAGAVLAALFRAPRRRRAMGLALVAGIGIGWIGLHLLWLEKLGHRVAESHWRYADKDFEVAVATGPDHELVALVRRVKESIGGVSGSRRIALVSQERYFGERGRYLLLPHPATQLRTLGNLRSVIPQLRSEDIVIAEGSMVPDVRRALVNSGIAFRRISTTHRGTAYLVTRTGAETDVPNE